VKLHWVQQHRLRLQRYLAPTSLEEALTLRSQLGSGAALVAGGSDLLLELIRGQRPEVDTLVDLSRIRGLDRIESEPDHLLIGATVTHNQVVTSPEVVGSALPLAQACWEVGSPQLRNRATVVGNVVTASPANDTISALRALGCEVLISSIRGGRRVDLAGFHPGPRQTQLEPDEIVTGLRVRKLRPSQRGLFVKLGLRRAQAISVVHLAAVLELAGPVVSGARLSLGSVAPTIVEANAATDFLLGRELDPETIEAAARLAAEGITPIDDLRASADYRRQAVAVMTRRALETLREGKERDQWAGAPITLGGEPTKPPEEKQFELGPETEIEVMINGSRVIGPGAAGQTLLDWLRGRPGLTGTKEGCAEGECGACTVYLDGKAVMSCLVPAGRAAGAEVTTIEGLASTGRLHPLQQAFIDQGAVQCGFCIPGFLMAGAKALQERPTPDRGQIAAALSGNLCRCTGYYKILAAVEEAAG
jgi:xanthine dehydrogenase iron-sulfur cluster and FAD-binding subunit A